MRNYIPDSPEARARIVALALLVDGSLDKSELDLLFRHEIVQRLGMTYDDFDRVVHWFCDDVGQSALRSDNGALDIGPEIIDELLGEILRREHQLSLLKTILEIACADRRISKSETVLASRAMHWWTIDLNDLAGEPVCPVLDQFRAAVATPAPRRVDLASLI